MLQLVIVKVVVVAIVMLLLFLLLLLLVVVVGSYCVICIQGIELLLYEDNHVVSMNSITNLWDSNNLSIDVKKREGSFKKDVNLPKQQQQNREDDDAFLPLPPVVTK